MDVIHSDADAVWVRNPLALLAYSPVPSHANNNNNNNNKAATGANVNTGATAAGTNATRAASSAAAPDEGAATAPLSPRQHALMRGSSLVASRGALRPHWLLCMGWLR